MKIRQLTLPEFMFVIATRVALGAGVAFLISGRLTNRQRRILGTALISIGAVTTIPAAMMVWGRREEAPEKIEP